MAVRREVEKARSSLASSFLPAPIGPGTVAAPASMVVWVCIDSAPTHRETDEASRKTPTLARPGKGFLDSPAWGSGRERKPTPRSLSSPRPQLFFRPRRCADVPGCDLRPPKRKNASSMATVCRKGLRSIMNPATGSVIAKIPRLRERLRRSARSRRRRPPFPGGAPAPARSGRPVLRRWFDLIIVISDETWRGIMTCEPGKPLAESRGEVAHAASSNGLARRRSARRGRHPDHIRRARPLSSSDSRSASSLRSCRGTFPPRSSLGRLARRSRPAAGAVGQAGAADASSRRSPFALSRRYAPAWPAGRPERRHRIGRGTSAPSSTSNPFVREDLRSPARRRSESSSWRSRPPRSRRYRSSSAATRPSSSSTMRISMRRWKEPSRRGTGTAGRRASPRTGCWGHARQCTTYFAARARLGGRPAEGRGFRDDRRSDARSADRRGRPRQSGAPTWRDARVEGREDCDRRKAGVLASAVSSSPPTVLTGRGRSDMTDRDSRRHSDRWRPSPVRDGRRGDRAGE